MIALAYALLMVNPAQYPISEIHTWLMLYEMLTEVIAIYSYIIYNVVKR